MINYYSFVPTMAILSKTWWRSLVKGDGSPDILPQDGDNDQLKASEAEDDFLFADLESSYNLADSDVEAPPREESGEDSQSDRGRNLTRGGRRDGGRRENSGREAGREGSRDRREPREESPPRLPARARVASAKDFFSEEAVYRFDLMVPLQREELKGDYRIEVKGNKGGVWSLKVDSGIEIVNRREDADVVVSMQQRDFVQLVNGDLNPQMAILAQKMKVLGNLRSVATLQSLLVPPGFD